MCESAPGMPVGNGCSARMERMLQRRMRGSDADEEDTAATGPGCAVESSAEGCGAQDAGGGRRGGAECCLIRTRKPQPERAS